eukprot:scaffold363_cov331-Pavlova_lutheri.AAC.58
MVTPSILPSSLRMVYVSSSAWVGCCPGPSPALMMGTDDASAAFLDDPAKKCLSTMMSAYPSTVLMVSSSVSPLAADEYSPADSVDRTLPPKRFMALSKDSLVLVDGS